MESILSRDRLRLDVEIKEDQLSLSPSINTHFKV